MLKQTGKWAISSSSPPMLPLLSSKLKTDPLSYTALSISPRVKTLRLSTQELVSSICCRARRRVRYDEDEDDAEEEYGHNEEIAMLELYSQSAREEALVVHALVDEQQVEVLIFKGYSSCLSYKTSPDPSKSVLPARAVIKTIDRIKGPMDPSNIDYLEKDLTWEAFKSRLAPN